MKTAYGIGRAIVLIAIILSVIINGTALAGVRLDLGSAPADPGVSPDVYPGDTVEIPLYLSNYAEDPPVVIATSTEITYDSTYLTPLAPSLGPQGLAAGKDFSYTIKNPGVYLMGIFGTTNDNLNTPILSGTVAIARFKVLNDTPAGTYILGNSSACTGPGGADIPLDTAINGFIEVTAQNSGSTTTTTVFQEECGVTIAPSDIRLFSTATAHFSATVAQGEYCSAPVLAWSVASTIGSTIDANGSYTAGENLTGAEAVDTVLVTDTDNVTRATAVVHVSSLPVGAISRIAPATIFSSRWRQRLHLLFISSTEGHFSSTSKLSFDPQGDIIPLLTIAAGRSILALVSVKNDVQGRYDVNILTDTMIYYKKDSLNVRPVFTALNGQSRTGANTRPVEQAAQITLTGDKNRSPRAQ
jgi:hypothetical protein